MFGQVLSGGYIRGSVIQEEGFPQTLRPNPPPAAIFPVYTVNVQQQRGIALASQCKWTLNGIASSFFVLLQTQ